MTKQLVIQLARFGDIMQTKRLLLSLRGSGETHLCVDKSLASLACMVYPDMEIHALPAFGGGENEVFTEGHTVLEQLRNHAFDTVYILNYAGMSRALARLFDPETVRGYPVHQGQALRSNWVRLAFRWMVDRAASPLNLVDFWAALAPVMAPPQTINPMAKPGGKGLGVVLSGQSARRSLPPEKLAPIVHAVFERLGGPTVWLLGGKTERAQGRALIAQLPVSVAQKTVDLAGKTNWIDLADALYGLDTLLSPDTGVVHLAAHLGVPVEGLYTSSAWAFETGPYGLGHRIWQTLDFCSPCIESAPCPRHTHCREAFCHGPFLARMQGRMTAGTKPLQGITLLQSGFDDLGEIWTSLTPENPDPFARVRSATSTLLAEYLGYGFARDNGPASKLYDETDWVLPQAVP